MMGWLELTSSARESQPCKRSTDQNACRLCTAGFLPMLLSLFFSKPWSSIVFHAETIQRWFLLALIFGKSTLVLDHWCGGGQAEVVETVCSLVIIQ